MPWKMRPRKAGKMWRERLQGTAQQEAIWDAIRLLDEHILMEARAGTGKTTTEVEGICRMMPGQRVLAAAFNRSIALTLRQRVPRWADAKTVHSLGLGIVNREVGKGVEVDPDKCQKLLDREWKLNNPLWRRRRAPFDLARPVLHLVSLVKSSCWRFHLMSPDEQNRTLVDLTGHFDIAMRMGQDETFGYVRTVLSLSRQNFMVVDYDDMIYLPLALEMPKEDYDALLGDEVQDWNACQQDLALACGRRLILAGDRYQSIYGFRGADAEAIPHLEGILSSDRRGLARLPLTISFRCPKTVAALARRLVNDFEALPGAPEGTISLRGTERCLLDARPGDMFLCRTNAPLVQAAFQLWREKMPAKIQGRNIGEGLIMLVERLAEGISETWTDKERMVEVSGRLIEYEAEEREKLDRVEAGANRYVYLQDKCACLRVFIEEAPNLAALRGLVGELFADRATEDCVLLSSVHRAKGLEAGRVFILSPELIPHGMAKQDWEKRQERNIAYVAATRVKGDGELIFAGGAVSPAFSQEEDGDDQEV